VPTKRTATDGCLNQEALTLKGRLRGRKKKREKFPGECEVRGGGKMWVRDAASIRELGDNMGRKGDSVSKRGEKGGGMVTGTE